MSVIEQVLSLSGLSMTQVAKKLGLTKGQVAGIRFRSRNKMVKELGETTMINIAPHQCRYVLRQAPGGAYVCCGRRIQGSSSWCPDHYKAVFTSKKPHRT